MYFQPARYMEFAKEMHVEKAECVLAFSGMTCPWTLEELGITPEVFRHGQFYPYGNEEIKDL